jgi:hypothetical protein
MYDCTDFFYGDAIVQGTMAVEFPFMHLSQGCDHGQVHHRTSLRVKSRIAPTEAPAPCRHGLLKRTSEGVGSSQIVFDVIRTERRFALSQALVEEILVHSALSFVQQKANHQVGHKIGHFGQDRMLLLGNDRQLRAPDPLMHQPRRSRV